MENVKVLYSDFMNSVIDEVTVELLPDILLSLKYNDADSTVIMSMSDKITANVELSGAIGMDELNVLIKSLSTLRGQLKTTAV